MMKIAIDGVTTLLGQTIAELVDSQQLTALPIISILHGNASDLETEDAQLDSNVDVQIEPQFFDDIIFSDLAIVFIADNQDRNKDTINRAINAGATVIDCANNATPDLAKHLLVHDINSHEIQGFEPGFVISVPSAGATMLSQIVFPMLQAGYGVERINVCHFAPAAQLGKTGVEQLAGQTARLLNGMPLPKKSRGEQVAFNLLPQSGAIDNFAYAETETLLMEEVKLLLNHDGLVVNASVIQAPVFYAQSQVIDLVFENEVAADAIEALLKRQAGVKVANVNQASPVALQHDEGEPQIVVSRIRQNPADERSLTLWCVSDNLRRGAAGNAVQIADLLIKSYL